MDTKTTKHCEDVSEDKDSVKGTKTTKFCEVVPEDKEKLKKFRMRKKTNIAALIFKVDKESQTISIDEEYEDCTMDEIREELPISQPRFLVVSTVLKFADGRVKYPQCIIRWSPLGCPPELNLLYATSFTEFTNAAELTTNYEIRDLEDLTDDWLEEKLKKFG